MGILDDAAKQLGSPTQPQATPAPTTPAAAPQGGSILDQAAAMMPETQTSTPAQPPQPSLADRWSQEAYEMVGKGINAIPGSQTLLDAAAKLRDRVLKPKEVQGREAGNALDIFTQNMDAHLAKYNPELLKRAGTSADDPLMANKVREQLHKEEPAFQGLSSAAARTIGQIAGDPTNWPFFFMGPLSTTAKRAMGTFFGVQMGESTYAQAKELINNWSSMTPFERWRDTSQLAMTGRFAYQGLKEGIAREPKVVTPTVGPQEGGEGPLPSTETGTVAGKSAGPLSKVKTRTTAGVEAPVSAGGAAEVEGKTPSILTRAAESLTTPGAEREFGKEQVAPAATRQAVSTLGQVAEDRIDSHKAVANNEAAPEAKTGTQHVSRFTTPDDAWQEMQKTAQDTTFHKADDISMREQRKWESERDLAIQEYKELVDRHNQNIDDYNAQVKPEDRMPRAVFDPNDAQVPERPLTYNELRAEVQKQEANAKSQDAAVREEAITKGLPKAQKAIDGWFRDHDEEISPAEYTSVKKLWADSERFKEIAMALRAPLTQETLTGSKMRKIEVDMNNRQLRRGQSPDAFQRLLGPDGYNNWQNVAKLFDTIPDALRPAEFSSWGHYAASFLKFALAPYVAFKWGTEQLLNHVMFDPEFGATFGKVVDWLKSRGGVPAHSIKELPGQLRDKLVGIVKSYMQSSERGAVGRDVPQGNEPQPEKFGRKGLGGEYTGEERRATRRGTLLTPTELEDAIKNRRSVRTAVDVTEGAQDTINRDIRNRFSPNYLSKGTPEDESAVHAAIADWHNKNKGFSFNPQRGFLRDEPVFSVAGEYPGERYNKVIKGQIITPEHVAEFANRPEVKAALQADPRNGIGGWNYKGDANLEISKSFDNRDEAIAEGKRLNQDSIYDHATRETIPTGGTAAEELRQAQLPTNRHGETLEHAQNQGEHTVTTRAQDGSRIGTLVAHDTRPGEVTISTNQIDNPDLRGAGRGPDQIQHLLDSVSPETKVLKSDISTTDSARSAWEKIAAEHPGAVTKKVYKDGQTQYTVDMDKYRNPDQGVTGPQFTVAADDHSQEISPRWSEGAKPEDLLGLKAINEANATPPIAVTKKSPAAELRGRKLTYKQKLAYALSHYDNGIMFPEDAWDTNPDHVIKRTVDHYVKNLGFLYDMVPDSIKAMAKQWYESAHRMTKEIADENGISHSKAAGVVSTLSPNNMWDNNVGNAKRLIDRWVNDRGRDFSPEMDDAATRIRNVKGPRSEEYPDGRPQPQGFLDAIEAVRGKRYDELVAPDGNPDTLNGMKALWLRLVDEVHGAEKTDLYDPAGNVRGSMTHTWGGLGPMGRAVEVLEGDGSTAAISKAIGDGHKTRNFYNNIINPWSEHGHVTIDTHAVRAALMSALGQKGVEVSHNFGSSVTGTPGAPSSTAAGVQGTYPVYDEAYRQVAGEKGVRPNQAQSILWEGIRSLFGENLDSIRKPIQDIWKKVQDGKMTQDAARKAIVELTGGFKKPAWMSQEAWDADPSKFKAKAETEVANPQGDLFAQQEPAPALPPRQEGRYRDEATEFNPADFQHQMVTVQGPEGRTLSADFNPAVSKKAVQWKGKPEPEARMLNGRMDPNKLDDLTDWYNANVVPTDALKAAAHEVSHAFLQHTLADATTNSLHIGHFKILRSEGAPIDGVAGGMHNPAGGWKQRYADAYGDPEKLMAFGQDFTTQLMAGKAIELMLGESETKAHLHAAGDIRNAMELMHNLGIPAYMFDGLLQTSLDRATSILKENFPTVKHIAEQAVQHFGREPIDNATFHKYRKGGVYEKK